MIISTKHGILKVNDQTQIPLTLTNPFLNDQGSHSMPFTVPYCAHNLMVLGYPDRHYNANSIITNIDCTISTNIFKDSGTLDVISVNQSDGIELSFLPREGLFWNWANKTNLRDINIPSYSLDITPENFQTTLYAHSGQAWPDVDFAFFPIATRFASLDHYENEERYHMWSNMKSCIGDYQMINNPGDLYRDDIGWNSSIVSPFIYVNAVLTWIANTIGLRINQNFLASTNEFKRLVVLNAAFHVYYTINYKLLLPKVTVADFITSLEDLFCCRFIINYLQRTIDIIHFDEIYNTTPKPLDGNLSVISSRPTSGVSFSAPTINSPYTTVSDRVFDNFFFNHYESQDGPLIDGKVYFSASTPDYAGQPNRIVFSVALQTYFYCEWIKKEDNLWEFIPRCIHTNLHDIKSDAENDVSINVKATLAPMVPVNFRQFYKDGANNEYFDFSMTCPFFDSWDWLFDFEDGILSPSAKPAPISFAFYRGPIVNISFPVELFGVMGYHIPWGNVDIYNPAGQVIAAPAVPASIALRFAGVNGLKDKFYSGYEKLIHNSKRNLSLQNVLLNDILNNDIYRKMYCDNTHVFIEKAELTLSPFGSQLDNIECRDFKPLI